MIDARVAKFGTVVNGWISNAEGGLFGTDYLFCAANTQYGFGANIAQEASIHSHLQIVKESL